MAKCLSNNHCKFHSKTFIYSEDNEIFVGGVFIAAPCTLYEISSRENTVKNFQCGDIA